MAGTAEQFAGVAVKERIATPQWNVVIGESDFFSRTEHSGGGKAVIARMWHGWTTRLNAEAYETHFRTAVLPQLEQVDGFLDAHLLRRDEGEEVEFVTLTYFESTDAIRAFAGDDYDQAVVAPEARLVLSRSDQRVKHYGVSRYPRTGGGR